MTMLKATHKQYNENAKVMANVVCHHLKLSEITIQHVSRRFFIFYIIHVNSFISFQAKIYEKELVFCSPEHLEHIYLSGPK